MTYNMSRQFTDMSILFSLKNNKINSRLFVCCVGVLSTTNLFSTSRVNKMNGYTLKKTRKMPNGIMDRFFHLRIQVKFHFKKVYQKVNLGGRPLDAWTSLF